MYDILGFLNFLHLPQITQYNFFILSFLVIENIIVMKILFFPYSLEENKFVLSSKLLPFSITSVNPIQNYLQIIDL